MAQKRIGVIMGGFSSERHISLESGRNVYTKLSASKIYKPLPIFLSGSVQSQRLFILPITLLLKDNADDIHKCLLNPEGFGEKRMLLQSFREKAKNITQLYGRDAIFTPQEISYDLLASYVDFVFIALHGRPGEDGSVQKILESFDIPYNGSGIETTALTIDKHKTNSFLRQEGFTVATQYVVTKEDVCKDRFSWIRLVEEKFAYPLIAKPVDDGCSTGVVKILNRNMLHTYADQYFSATSDNSKGFLENTNGYSVKSSFLLEECIQKDLCTADCFEITIGLLTRVDQNNKTIYDVFEPSEVFASTSILSLEEKFLAGEGHNITPARFCEDTKESLAITEIVKKEIKRAAMALNIQGYARIDAFVKIGHNRNVSVWIIEVNALPAMTPATCLFHQCVLHGYTPLNFMEAIIQYGLTKRNFQSRKTGELYSQSLQVVLTR